MTGQPTPLPPNPSPAQYPQLVEKRGTRPQRPTQPGRQQGRQRGRPQRRSAQDLSHPTPTHNRTEPADRTASQNTGPRQPGKDSTQMPQRGDHPPYPHPTLGRQRPPRSRPQARGGGHPHHLGRGKGQGPGRRRRTGPHPRITATTPGSSPVGTPTNGRRQGLGRGPAKVDQDSPQPSARP